MIPLRYLILQNCLLSSTSAFSLLSIFSTFPGKIHLSLLDLGNNSITFTSSLSALIIKVFEKSSKSEEKKLKLQGNLFPDRESLAPLINSSVSFDLLNLYDCCLSPEVLISLSDQLSQNLLVTKLDLSYNPSCFSSKSSVFTFAVAVGLNNNLQCLKLSGVTPLSKLPFLEKFCVGVKNSASLEKIILSNVPFGDKGLKTLRKKFYQLGLSFLDLQNTSLTCFAISKFLRKLPPGLVHLNLAYNLIGDQKFLMVVSKFLANEKSLRHLNLSYCFSFERIDENVLKVFCRGVTENRSLSELFLEGCKINDDPDEFCKMLSIAIEDRKYPICFKISAVRTNCANVEKYLSKTQDRILKDITE
jgi:hypothetical protein